MENSKKVTIWGFEFLIPAETEKYLEFVYGDWRTPRAARANDFLSYMTSDHFVEVGDVNKRSNTDD